MERLIALSAQMAREGIRRLLVISGEATWCAQQANALITTQDALWVGDEQDASQAAHHCHPRALTTLLGRDSAMPFLMPVGVLTLLPLRRSAARYGLAVGLPC